MPESHSPLSDTVMFAVATLIAAGSFAFSALGTPNVHAAELNRKGPVRKPVVADVPVEFRRALPTDGEAEQWAEEFANAILAEDQHAAEKLVDLDALIEIATRFNDPVKSFQDYRNGFRKSWNKGKLFADRFFGQIIGDISEGGAYTLLRIRRTDGEVRVIFRHLYAEEGLNYQEFRLLKEDDGKVRAVDVFNHFGGTWVTADIRRTFLQAGAAFSRRIEGGQFGGSNEFVRSIPYIASFQTQVLSGRFEEALINYEKLPKTVRENRDILMLRMVAAIGLEDDERHLKIFKETAAIIPNDPALDMLGIDGHLIAKEYDKSLACIDRVDKTIGGDPSLQVMRANVLVEQKKYEEARALCDKAIAEEPDLLSAHWSLVSIALAEKKFQETADRLSEIENSFEVEFVDLEKEPIYAEFVKSPEYKRWMEQRKKALNACN